jgi:hypothetical protein
VSQLFIPPFRKPHFATLTNDINSLTTAMPPCSHTQGDDITHYRLIYLLTQTSRAAHSASRTKENQGAFRTKNEQIPTPIDLNEAKNASQSMPPVIMPCKVYPKTHSARYGDGESHEYPSSLISRDARTGPLPARVPHKVIHPKRKIATNRSILRPQPRMCILQASLTFDGAVSMLLD